MTRGDFKLRTPISDAYSQLWVVDSGTTTEIEAGEPTAGDDSATTNPWTGEVGIMSDGQGSTSQRFTGIAKSDSTETSGAAGEVYTWMPLPGIIYSGKAKTTSDFDTEAEVKALHGQRCVFDLTGVVWTIDTEATDAIANCVVIVGGDHNKNVVFWMYRFSGTYLNFSVST